MHHAPAVTYPVGPARLAGCLLLGAWLAGAAVLLAWAAQPGPMGERHAAGALAWLGGGWAALRSWQGRLAGVLRWDGACWYGAGVGQASASVRLDLQDHLLLQLRGTGGGVRWAWAERAAQPQRWGDLRRAVYSRAMPELPAAGGSPGFPLS